MAQAKVFEFTSYQFEPSKKRVVFHYATKFEGREPIQWTETILLPETPNLENIPKEITDKLLASLHIILGISYYKFYCPAKVKLPYTLSKGEADFWNTVYKKGLGEFFYKNKLDPKISPKFPSTKTSYSNVLENIGVRGNKVLVGIGGGKDSIVAAKLLKERGFDITAFVVQNTKESNLTDKIIEILEIGDLKIQRILDKKVHQQHQYNGHIPISAIYAFLGVFAAVLYRYSYVVVGNEYSSNFGNIKYKGMEVNHQWSKSYEFETLFQNYIKDFISPDVFYFSLLRPFYEIRIVKMFAKYKKYFSYFSSCNSNFKTKEPKPRLLIRENKQLKNAWCGQCPKCVFVFILLSPFLSKKDLLTIFGKNLYEDKTLLPLFKDILGFGNMKPFDCVGTFQEAQVALYLAIKRNKDFIACPVVKALLSATRVRQLSKKAKYHQEVFQTNRENSIPELFKFLGMENVLIAGYGKEGQTTKQHLKKYYPQLKIGIADQKQGSGYLKNQKNFDIAVKTPGIKKELVTIPYTTATNIFFSHLRQGFGGQAKVKGKNLIIGVTGSKGKSTTASLIYHILKTAGKKVKLLGNIGTPMLEIFTKTKYLTPNTYFVLELSSYQLDDIAFSPDISVVTNLLDEHKDYHGTMKNYHYAKKNIIRFQNKDNYFVYDPKSKESVKWLKEYRGKAMPFSTKIFESNLIGEHNKSNIKAAITVAEILNIPKKIIRQAIKNFKALPHRLEFVGEFKGITFINDANAAIPEATIMAIESIPNIGTIFLGGTDRGYNFTVLEKTIKKHGIKNLVLFPDSGRRIIKNILRHNLRQAKGYNILKTKSMKEAVLFAYKNTGGGQVCLLSCASPSYSVWKNFEEKGDQFRLMVKKLAR